MVLSIHQIIKECRMPVLIALVSKLLILIFLWQLVAYIIPPSRAIRLNIWEVWNVWDAPHYISLARSGYQIVGDPANFIAFLPLLPILIFIFHAIFQLNYLISGYTVSLVSSVLLGIMLYKLTLLDYPKKIAILTVLMLFIFPTSFFLHIPYTESLFILLSVAAFYSIRRKNYWLSFLFIGLATATKIAGLALIPAIFAEIFIFDRKNFNSKSIYNKLSILFFGLVLSLSGFLVYLFLNYFLWGDFFHFTIVRSQHWFTNFAPFGQGLLSTFDALSSRVGLEKIMLGYAQIIAFFLGLTMSIYVLIKVRVSYGLFMLLVLWISHSVSFWTGMPRFILSLFPMFIALALLSEYLVFRYFWILISVTLLIVLSLIFIQYGPVL